MFLCNMILSNPLLNFIINLLIILLLKILPIILFLFIIYFLRNISIKKNTEYSYKIFDFDFNGFCIIIYFLFYFCLVLWIRINYFSQTTDLKQIIKSFKEKYLIENSFDTLVNILILFSFLLCVIYLVKILHSFFIKQIIKRFLILQINSNLDLSSYSLFILERKMDKFLSKTINYCRCYCSEKTINIMWKIGYKGNHFIVTIFPTIFLYLFFAYEIIFNELVITPNFYKYLFFYFIYHVYKRISLFISDTDWGLNLILYRMYYKEKSIKYVNIPKDYQDVILRYIQLGLNRNMNKYPEPLLDNILGEFVYYNK